MSTSVNIFRNTISSSSSGGGKEEQTKSVTITENGTTTITPDEGKTLASVTVNTEVSGGTVVSAVGKSVYFKSIDYQNWTIAGGNLSYDNCMIYGFSIVDNLVIAVTTDGNEPQVDLSNVLFGTEDINSELEIVFKIEVNGVVYKAVLSIFNPIPES